MGREKRRGRGEEGWELGISEGGEEGKGEEK